MSSADKTINDDAGDDDSEVEDVLQFATLDLTGVDFDNTNNERISMEMTKADQNALELEYRVLTHASSLADLDESMTDESASPQWKRLLELSSFVVTGDYIAALKSDSANWLLSVDEDESDQTAENVSRNTFLNTIETKMVKLQSVADFVEAEIVAVAAFNLFLQLNYTGPVFDNEGALDGINPHPCFVDLLNASVKEKQEKMQTITAQRDTRFNNSVLSELAMDGTWPCQVAEAPYMLLLARSLLSSIVAETINDDPTAVPSSGSKATKLQLTAAPLWSARAAVAQQRLLVYDEPSERLWKEVKATFELCLREKTDAPVWVNHSQTQATIYLEYGLACYYFELTKAGKALFGKAMNKSGISVEVTGSEGKRTKFQTKSTAQMIVKATSNSAGPSAGKENGKMNDSSIQVKSQMVDHPEESILFENVKYENASDNETTELTVLDQTILLALCLDVKNTNPADGLTGEEMAAYLSRVLRHHDDWIVYSTALLERAWLEFEGNHTKERAILQMQALADQHTNRLTLTQSTRKSVEDSSPVQDRLKYLHSIVYPPRWLMLRDIAERYASLGIVTSAAEIFTEIEYWDEVVDCYRRAGKESKAEEIVRERLAMAETPRMWMVLGDITNEPSHYEKAIELSKGRFSQAYISLGKYYFDKGELDKASESYKKALQLRPLIPSVWFRVGTICMHLGDWDGALTAFSEVVQQQPEEAEAWANVAAVHMRNKRPTEAYPALVESLKQNRNNWRIWVSKLYTCLDLDKYDEAIQACTVLMDLKVNNSVNGVPDIEEKCVRAIVAGTISRYEKALLSKDAAALDSERRSMNRVHGLLERLLSTSTEPWVFEVKAFFHEQVGQDKEVFENLMKEYRALSAVRSWEKDDQQVQKVCNVVAQIVTYQRGSKEELVKSRFLLSNVIKKVQTARVDSGITPAELKMLEILLDEVTAEIQKKDQDSQL
jgi:tetratricopeptide (TPR) repeat protein